MITLPELVPSNSHHLRVPTSEDDTPSFGTELMYLCELMFGRMRQEGGIGLAAPQVGLAARIAVMYDLDGVSPVFLINPVITETSDVTSTAVEGCLSHPGIRLDITRPESIVVEFFTPQGARMTRSFSGIHARCVQHEIDHLDGVCIVDKVSALKLERARRKRDKRKD